MVWIYIKIVIEVCCCRNDWLIKFIKCRDISQNCMELFYVNTTLLRRWELWKQAVDLCSECRWHQWSSRVDTDSGMIHQCWHTDRCYRRPAAPHTRLCLHVRHPPALQSRHVIYTYLCLNFTTTTFITSRCFCCLFRFGFGWPFCTFTNDIYLRTSSLD